MTVQAAPVTGPQDERRRRNTVRLAVAHALLALGFLVAFVWVQIHK